MIHFSLHTEFSYLSGGSHIENYVRHCKDNNITHLAITDYGTLSGILDLQKECVKNGIKPIFGCNVFMSEDKEKKDVPNEIKQSIIESSALGTSEEAMKKYAKENNYTLGENAITNINLWAMDNVGLKNLYYITSKAWIDGFYYKPRTDIKSIIANSEGLCVGTGSKSSYINSKIIAGNIIEAKEIIESLHATFGDRLIVELPVQYNLNNKRIIDFYLLIRELIPNATYIPSSNVHFLDKESVYKHRALSTIGKKYHSDDIDINSNGLDSDDYYFHSDDEILQRLTRLGVNEQDSKLFINNTQLLADRFSAQIEIKPFAMIMPKEIGLDNDKRPEEFLQELCEKSNVWSSIHEDSKALYLARTAKEITALKNQNFTKYVLYIKCILDMARTIDCTIGPGRGSAAGSIVNWLLGNTDIDPIKHDLSFERYIDPDRVNPPDNDIDVDPSKRGALIQLMRDRWGSENVAFINTLSQLKGRSAFKDVCRIMNIPISVAESYSKLIPNDPLIDHNILQDVFETEAFIALDKRYPGVKKYAIGIEGFYRQTGIHAAGVVCTDLPIYFYVPVETRSDGDGRSIVTAFHKDNIEDTGVLKVDLLGLDAVQTIKECEDEIRKTIPDFSIKNISEEDQNVIDAFTAKNFDAIFQYDSPSSRKLCANLNKFNSFIDVSHITALNRPGPLNSGMAFEYIKNCNEESTTTTYHKDIDHITKHTYGILVYQEQVMKVFADIQGHTNPDKVRKLIAKSKGVDEIEKIRGAFIEGSLKLHPDIPPTVLNKLFDDIVTFGNYAFNASHSVAYAKIGYVQQYLKVYHPLEFWYSMIKNAKDEKVRSYVYASKKSGIEYLESDINLSEGNLSYSKERNLIVGGLSSIKGIGEKASEEIAQQKPFTSFHDFYTRVNKRRVNAGVIKALVLSGSMTELIKHNKIFLENFEELAKDFNKSKPSFTNWDDKLVELIEQQNIKDYPVWKKKEMTLQINPSSVIDPFEEEVEQFNPELATTNIQQIELEESIPGDISTGSKLYTIRGTVLKVLDYVHMKSKTDAGTERQNAICHYGESKRLITLSTPDGETRFYLNPDLYARTPNIKFEEGDSLFVVVHSPYKGIFKSCAVFNLSNLDKTNPFYQSLYHKLHPTNSQLPKLNRQEAAFAKVSNKVLFDKISNGSINAFASYGVIIGIGVDCFQKFEKVFITINTFNGPLTFSMFAGANATVESIIHNYKLGDYVRAQIETATSRGKLEFKIRSPQYLSKIN